MALLALLGLGGCSITGVLSATTPGAGGALRDISYAAGPRHTLDIYRPARRAEPAPVVVFFYGGTWQMGDKADYAFVGKALAAKGFLAVIPDYRLYPEVRYPEFLRDGAQAVRWARDNASRYGGDPRRLFLMGHSAGAYNAVMLTVDERWLAQAGVDARRELRGTVGISGPYDFLPLSDPTLMTIFGPEATRPRTQPVAYVDGKEPPLLLLHGLKDTTVYPRNTERLAARVSEQGGRAEARFYKGLNHTGAIGAVAAPLRFLAPVLEDSVRFMERQGAAPAG
ncbi:MAG TPA: alpha/beta hydrolase [Caulobacteraceae bacterium]